MENHWLSPSNVDHTFLAVLLSVPIQCPFLNFFLWWGVLTISHYWGPTSDVAIEPPKIGRHMSLCAEVYSKVYLIRKTVRLQSWWQHIDQECHWSCSFACHWAASTGVNLPLTCGQPTQQRSCSAVSQRSRWYRKSEELLPGEDQTAIPVEYTCQMLGSLSSLHSVGFIHTERSLEEIDWAFFCLSKNQKDSRLATSYTHVWGEPK